MNNDKSYYDVHICGVNLQAALIGSYETKEEAIMKAEAVSPLFYQYMKPHCIEVTQDSNLIHLVEFDKPE